MQPFPKPAPSASGSPGSTREMGPARFLLCLPRHSSGGNMKSRTHHFFLAALLLTLAPAMAGAEPAVTPTVSLDRCATDDAERIHFLEQRLDSRRTYADYWWKGWMGAYALGTVIEGVQASTHDDDGRKADYA